MIQSHLQPPSLDTWTTIFLLAAGQGLFLAFSLYFNSKGSKQSNYLLGTFILLFAITLVDYVGYWSGYNVYFPNIRGIYEYLVFMFGPLLFLYFKSVYSGKAAKADYFHFAGVLVFYCLNKLHWHNWLPNEITFLNIRATLIILHLSAYGILSALFLSKNYLIYQKSDEAAAIIKRWHRTLLALYGGFILGWAVYFLLIRTPYFTLFYDYSISISMTVFIYTVGYLGYKQPAIFSGESMLEVFLPTKYRNSTLTPGAALSIKELLLKYMEKERPYLDNELRLTTLSNNMGVSTHHLSQVINEHFNKSFSDFINGYRVEAVRKMLSDPKFGNKYIIDIAFAAGFNNKTTFNKVFKEVIGTSPTSYKNSLQAKHYENLPQKAGY